MLHFSSNKVRNLLFITVLWPLSITIVAQTNKEFKKLFIKAESYFLYEEDYPIAVPLYLSLLEKDPGNANINYKVGVCYLGIPGKKKESILYLEEAVKNTTIDFKDDDYRERRAPLVARFYLGHAYQVNNRIDDAITEYKGFPTAKKALERINKDYRFQQAFIKEINNLNR